MNISEKTTFTESIETWNSGGNVMLDVIKLKSGKILIISDEVVCKYNSIEEFYGDEGEYDYNKYCVDLLDQGVKITKQPDFKSGLIGKPFLYEGFEIVDPFVSECGRFIVDPNEYYGEAYKKSLEG